MMVWLLLVENQYMKELSSYSDISLQRGDEACLIASISILLLAAAFALIGLLTVVRSEMEKREEAKTGTVKLDRDELAALREKYPEGSTVVLENIVKKDPDHPLHYGDRGTVEWIDDYGNLFVKWERNGLRARLISGTDLFRAADG